MYGFKEVDSVSLKSMQDEGKAKIIDVRTDAEVARGKIDGATHIPLHLLPMKLDELPKDIPLVFYCQTGGRSSQACAFLASKGFDNVYNLQGGVAGWMRAGLGLANAV